MHIRDIHEKHKNLIDKVANKKNQMNLLCELNVIEQSINVCQTTVVQDAWERGKNLTVHGWIYGLHDGLLNDLGICISDNSEIYSAHSIAVSSSYETFLNREK
jgi:carbonic anhydrase